MRRFSRLGVAALLAAGLAAAAAWGAAAHTSAKVPASCDGLVYAHMGPLTGANAVLGQEQLTWDKFELSQFNATHHTNFKLFEADDQLSAAQGSTVAQQIVSNPKILAVVGPAGSQVVIAAGAIFTPAGIAMVSQSATDASLMDIGQQLGGRDHTTVIYGCEKIGEEINADSRLRQEVVTIRERLYHANGTA